MIGAVIDALLYVVIGVCAVTDIKDSRVLNIVTYPAIAAGLILATIADGSGGFLNSVFGFSLGFAMMFFLFLWGGFGGGDVKLMGAVGAIKGYPFILYAAFYSAIVGGIYSLALIIWKGRLKRTFLNIVQQFVAFVRPSSGFAMPLDKKESIAIPFGFCICLGTLWAMLESFLSKSVMDFFFS